MLRNLLLGGTSPLALFAPETGAGTAPAAPAAPAPAPVSTEPLTIKQATESFLSRRERGETAAEMPDPEPDETTEQPTRAPDGKFAAQAQESTSQEGDTAAETPSGEETGAEAETPIDPPRSWTKAEKERFATLPRETQAYLAERESARDTELNRRQQEAAERTRALEAKEQAADQARTQYETAAQNALRVLDSQIASEFADIKTYDDVVKMAAEDPFRAIQFKARQDQLTALHQEVQANEQKRVQGEEERFNTWSKEQDDKFTKQFPEFVDNEKGPKVRQAVTSYLTKEIGVPEAALQKLWNTDLFRDAMWQRVVYDASRFHAAQQAAKSAVQKPVPQVQRPGTTSTKGERGRADIAALSAALDSAKGERNQIAAAAALRAAKRAAAH